MNRLHSLIFGFVIAWCGAITCPAAITFDNTQSIVHAEIFDFPDRTAFYDSATVPVGGLGNYTVAVLGNGTNPSWANNSLSISTSSMGATTITGVQSLAHNVATEGALTGTFLVMALDCNYDYVLNGEFIATDDAEGEFNLISPGSTFSTTSIYSDTFVDSGTLSVGDHTIITPFASSDFSSGEYHWSVTLTPTGDCATYSVNPEPSAFGLLAMALLMCFRLRR